MKVISKKVFVLSAVLLPAALAPAAAQDGAMKICGDKWQALKAAGTTEGKTWPKYLAECRATLAAAKPDASAKPAEEAKAASARQPTGKIAFPSAIPEKYASLKPAAARRKTCGDQFKANKADNANGGLRWIEQGGGYWSLCNRKLKS